MPLDMREYDQIAEWYTAVRNLEVGVPDMEVFARMLPPRAKVLDLGCGDGIPISQILAREGLCLSGLDSSPEMIARYRANFPGVSTRCERVEEVDFAVGSFEGVVAWGVLFHLTEAKQKALIRQVSEWLKPGGQFLFTSGGTAGVSESEMNGVTFQYVSLGASAYRHLIEQAGMRLEDDHSDAWDNHVYVAKKAT